MRNVAPREKTRDHAVLFEVETRGERTYCVRLTAGHPPAVHGFPSLQEGLRYFERAHALAHTLGAANARGARLSWLELKPRIFPFASMVALAEFIGTKGRIWTLHSRFGSEAAVTCSDQALAARVYREAHAPTLAIDPITSTYAPGYRACGLAEEFLRSATPPG